jgi:PAS domain S-box-containing protein
MAAMKAKARKKRSAPARIQSANEISDLYNNAPCGYQSLDADGVIVRINDTELAWLGYSREEIVGKVRMADLMTPESKHIFEKDFPIFKERGYTGNLELDIKRRDGALLSVLLNATAIRDGNGSYLMSRSTLYDITERRETERQVKVVNELLYLFAQNFTRREYLDAACRLLRDWSGCRHVGVRIVNPDDKVPFEACCGYDEEFLKQENDLSLTGDRCICTRIIAGAPEPSDLGSLTARGSFVSNNSLEFEKGLSSADRSRYRGVCVKIGFKSLAVIPIKYREKAIGAIHLADDQEGKFTPERVKFLEQLAYIVGEAVFRFGIEDEQKRLASALDSTAEAVVITDPHTGVIRYMNPAFSQVTGYSRDEVIGRTLHFLDSGKQDAEFYDSLRKALTRNGFWQGRLVNRKKDGTLYFEDCTFSPVRNSAGEIINYVSVRRDVTEKLRLESIAEAVNTMDSIGYVFAGVRHEIGNPINSAKSILTVLIHKLDTAPPERIRDYADRALNEVGRVEQVLRSLRSYSLYETPEIKDVRIDILMNEFRGLISEDLHHRGISLSVRVDPDVVSLRADTRALQQVLLNIITNEMDALEGRPEPRIDVVVSHQDGTVLLRISDNGKGITEQQQNDLFKPFYTSKPHGTGLGLVIVKKMVILMNGGIEISSRAGLGTDVTITLEGTEHV